MKDLKEYISSNNKENKYVLNRIRFDLDEKSFESLDDELKQYVLEMNQTVWKSKDGDELSMGDHAIQRQDRPIDKGGDGKRIERQEIIDMFRWAWSDIMEMLYSGKLNRYFYNGKEAKSWTIQSDAFIESNDKDLEYKGARSSKETLWAAWMTEEFGNNVDIIIRTIFRGETFKHSPMQERIHILNNGKIQKRFKGKNIK